jgi:hypothetical protein
VKSLARNFLGATTVFTSRDDVRKAYLTNVPTKIWALLVIPAVAVAYPVVCIVVPAVIHAVVPDAVRTVLNLI